MNIGLLGCGVVGSGVKEIIDSSLDNIKLTKILVKDENEKTEERMTTDIENLLTDEIDIIVECIGGIDIPLNYIKKALSAKKHVVTSNKKVMATHYKELIKLAEENNVIIAFEASVGGGIPWLENIRHIKKVDKILNFKGIFNGTTNYILDKMFNENKDFNVVLKEAQNLGYAEANPTDDIDGFDVKYKCCLSANTIWDTSVNLNEISFLGIRNIEKIDIDYAKENNKTIKLIGSGFKNKNKLDILVIPTFINNSENIAHIPNNLNSGIIQSEYLGASSYIGQGAGKFPTAHAVVQDILSICENKNMNPKIKNDLEISNESTYNFYIRLKNLNQNSNIDKNLILKNINEDTIITKNISIDNLLKFYDKEMFIARIEL